MAKTALIFTEECLAHDTGPTHPERPARLRAIEEAFKQSGLNPPRVKPPKATEEDLLRVHSRAHIDAVRADCEGRARYGDLDTPMSATSWDAALLAAGGAIEACRLVLDGEYTHTFCLTRPPGHHAERDRAMGFCLFNNVAVAAQWLRQVRGLDRVAILDWDVHHGNGTQEAFYDDPSVYYVSIHQYPHYPGTGRAEERGANNTVLNLPIPPGAPAVEWMNALKEKALPELEHFAPDFLLISAGFDAHRLDPLGDQNLEAEHFSEMTRMFKRLAGGNSASLLEGGYNLHGLAESALAHYLALEE